ncbi:MAG: phytanoyl-CoA dioxygenase family protein [Planctomycetes bacterium]|nr:phytanoyl-CoA dioxygenase family protein [Planctomycetota bacterium]
MAGSAVRHASPADAAFFRENGYLIVRGLFGAEEVKAIAETFDKIGAAGQPIPNHWVPTTEGDGANDPLRRYPRVMMPHRFDDLSKRMMLHAGVRSVLETIVGEDLVACQSMFYFKPPGGKGQALHQDNFYLEVQPDTCYAAWLAVDPSTTGNGGLNIVPGSHRLGVICPEASDGSESFTSELVPVPEGMKAIPADLKPGDVLFFGGSVIHGSGPNKSATTWRRSFICHYMPRTTASCSRFYFPILDFDGNEIPFDASKGGGPCGSEVKLSSYDKVG